MSSSSDTNSGSVQTVVTSLISNGAIFLVFIAAFIVLRPRQRQFYDKRVYASAVAPNDRPRPLEEGYFRWFMDLASRPDSDIIRDTGLDGYFFLRYLRFLFYIAMLGIVILMPILLPVNATNGHNYAGFDLLAFGNIKNSNRYYAHVFLSWIFFGLTLFFIYRESLFYTATRQAVLTSESHKYLLSSRTVLINDVPKQHLDEEYLRSVFTGVRHVFVSRDAGKLQEAVEKRAKLASKIEGTENSMLRKAMKKRLKAEKKGKVSTDEKEEISTYIKKPPTHRLGLFGGKFPFFGKKVETIPYAKEQFPELSADIEELQGKYNTNEKRAAAFLVFDTQFQAEVAVQMLAFHRPLQMAPRTIGVSPDEVVWSNLSLRWWQSLIKSLGASTFCVALVILWAIPVAFVGFISQIKTLMRLFPWLSFLNNLPNVLFGLISSLLPQILLAVLMMLLPIVIRKAAKIAGAPTDTHVEYYTQNVYFAFQVVQVFLVTTLSSSIIAALHEILEDPGKILPLLQNNLPRASNFFMSYLLLQALTIPSGAVLQIVGLLLYYALGFVLDNTPRKIWSRRNDVGGTQWGTVFPIYSNLAVIMLCYSIICPLIMPFAAALFLFVYYANLNNLTFVSGKTNGRGIYYARALQHLFVGIYLAEIVLIVLFVFSKSWGPLVLEVVMGLFTVWFHVHLGSAFDPMLFSLPQSLLDSTEPSSAAAFESLKESSTASLGRPARRVVSTNSYGSTEKNPFQGPESRIGDAEIPLVNDDVEARSTGGAEHDAVLSGGFVQRIFKPHLYYTPENLKRELLSADLWHQAPTIDYAAEVGAFNDPAMQQDNPVVWFPEDPHGWAEEQLVSLRDAGINAYTSGAWFEINEAKKKSKILCSEDVRRIPIYDASESA